MRARIAAAAFIAANIVGLGLTVWVHHGGLL